MSLRKHAPVWILAVAMVGTTFGVAETAQEQSPKQDMKDAGHSTKSAAKDTGRATKKTAKKYGPCRETRNQESREQDRSKDAGRRG